MNLRKMNAVAQILRRRRAEAGALQLASPEVKFEIDTETHDPLDVGMYQARPALLIHLLQAILPCVLLFHNAVVSTT